MTRPEIEPRSPGPLVNTLTITPMFGKIPIEIRKKKDTSGRNPKLLTTSKLKPLSTNL